MSKPNLERAALALSRMANVVGVDERGEADKTVHWNTVDKTAHSFEGKAASLAKQQFGLDERNILALLSKSKAKSLETNATIPLPGPFISFRPLRRGVFGSEP